MKGRMKINEGYLQLVKRKDSTEEGDRLIEGAQEEGQGEQHDGLHFDWLEARRVGGLGELRTERRRLAKRIYSAAKLSSKFASKW